MDHSQCTVADESTAVSCAGLPSVARQLSDGVWTAVSCSCQ